MPGLHLRYNILSRHKFWIEKAISYIMNAHRQQLKIKSNM